MGMTAVIKDVEEEAFRSLRGEAAKLGLKIGEAPRSSGSRFSRGLFKGLKMLKGWQKAARTIDETHAGLRVLEGCSGMEEIRKWRELPRLLIYNTVCKQ